MTENIETLKKVCTGCLIDLPYSKYHKKTKNGNVTVQAKCKECTSVYKKNRYWANHDVELAKMTKSRLKAENILQRKEYYEKNKASYTDRHKKYWADEEKRKHKLELSSKRYFENRDKIRERQKGNYQKPETKEKVRLRHKRRKETDVVYNIKIRLRHRLRVKLKEISKVSYKYRSSLVLLGCDMSFFKKYIENKFTDGMSWERISEIHLDHIIPLSSFDLTNIDEQRKAFHYSNLQPLWWHDNLRKGSKLEYKIAS